MEHLLDARAFENSDSLFQAKAQPLGSVHYPLPAFSGAQHCAFFEPHLSLVGPLLLVLLPCACPPSTSIFSSSPNCAMAVPHSRARARLAGDGPGWEATIVEGRHPLPSAELPAAHAVSACTCEAAVPEVVRQYEVDVRSSINSSLYPYLRLGVDAE